MLLLQVKFSLILKFRFKVVAYLYILKLIYQTRMSKALGIVISVALIVGVGGYFLATKANAATPADSLFAVDTTFESVQRLLTLDDVAKVNLEQAILEERQEEIETMLGDEDVTDEELGEAVRLMAQQRLRAYERLGEVAQKQEEKGNTNAAEAIQTARERYLEHLDQQLETANKAQKKIKDVDKDITEEMEQEIEEEKNTLKNTGENTQNQQQNEEKNTDNKDNGKGNN